MRIALCATAIAVALVAGIAAPAAAETGGVIPPGAAGLGEAPKRPSYLPDEATGLKVFYRKYGKLQLAVGAAGKSDPSGPVKLSVKVDKPSKDAKVLKAYLMSATWNYATIPNGALKLDGTGVTWMATYRNGPTGFETFFQSTLADVTSIVKKKLDKADPGAVKFNIVEPSLSSGVDLIDGETLVVVFDTPKDQKPRTIALLFGGQKPTGDRFAITLGKPIDPKKKNARAEMGLGVSFSQQPSNPGNPPQYTTINVNGLRLTTSAGGQDDGAKADGALITAGGLGDKAKNPTNPNALPTGARDDDERYSLLPFLGKKTKLVTVETLNPSRDDNIFFAWFDLATDADIDVEDDKDTDGDGLLDRWEVRGLDYDNDGKIDVDLPKLGANPKKKDIFIAYAWMNAAPGESASHQPTQAELDAVAGAFARAPVANPDGTQGVIVHWKNLGGVAHDADLNPVWTEFDAIMNPLVSLAERKVYRRMLNGHGYGGGGSSGIARGIPASDFAETLGVFSSNPGTFTQRAGTIMHELGHTLGLRHGGVDNENYKPNHLSVMSYFNQLGWLTRNGAPWLDYDRFSLSDLNESSLNEVTALDSTAGEAALSIYGVRWFAGGSSFFKTSQAQANVNWNGNGSSSDVAVVSDVNGSGTLSTLRGGFLEWDNIIYDGGDIGVAGIASMLADPQNDLREMTEQDALRIEQGASERK